MLTKSSLLLAAALLTAGAAAAQTSPNTRPTAQGRPAPAQRGVFGNAQIQATERANAIDNQSFVSQVGGANFGAVTQTGNQQVADLVQVSSSSATRGNDAYQTQSNGTTGLSTGKNDVYMAQYGERNYGDQVQSGALNVAVTLQGRSTSTQVENYSVQDQTGGSNYGYVAQESSRNFAHQKQTSDASTTIGGGLAPSSNANGNYAVTLQGGAGAFAAGSNGTDGQWSQTIQNGQNNRAIVSQDH